ARKGTSYTPVIRKADGAFLGFNGLCTIDDGFPNEGLPEIGWRMNRAAWGYGYATEAARAWLVWGWANLDADRIASITSVNNRRSQAVMERLGMRRDPTSDFDHRNVPDGSPLKAHVTYVIDRPAGA
ncbi:MAG: GNAT family N-acetyltransferase, partial [Pacificimonas sp.]